MTLSADHFNPAFLCSDLSEDAEGKSGCSEWLGSGFGKILHTHPAGERSSGDLQIRLFIYTQLYFTLG